MDVEKQLFGRLKSSLPIIKSKKFLAFAGERYPNKILHHLLGSYTSIKLTDLLIVPVTLDEHDYAEKHKIKFAFENVHVSIRILMEYVQYLEGGK